MTHSIMVEVYIYIHIHGGTQKIFKLCWGYTAQKRLRTTALDNSSVGCIGRLLSYVVIIIYVVHIAWSI